MNAARIDRALNHSVAEGALATVMGSLLSGVFLTGFALHLGASRLQIGILAAIPTFANLAQLAGAYVIERNGRSKLLCEVTTWASRLLWLPVLLVPVFFSDRTGVEQTWSVIAILTVSSVLGSMSGVAWLAWTKRLVPREQRIAYFGRRNLFNTGLAFTMSVAGAVLLDWWNSTTPGSLAGFLAIFTFAMLCGLLSAAILRGIPEPEPCDHLPKPFWNALREPWQTKNFRRLMIFYATWNLASSLATPFFAVYMLQRLQLPFWVVTLLATLSSVVGLLLNQLWARLKVQFGIRPVVLVATMADAFMPLCWLFVSPQTIWLLVPIHLFGAFSAPLATGPNNLLLKIAPEKNSASYLALFNAVTGPITAIGAIAGGLLAGLFQGIWEFGPFEFSGLQLLFLVSGVGRFLSLGLLYHVAEPQAEPVRRLVRVLHRAQKIRRVRRRAAPRPLMRRSAKSSQASVPDRVRSGL